jgi:hypothetical protein
MESLVAAAVFVPVPGWVFVAGGVLSVVALAASVAVLGFTAIERDAGLLARGPWICVTLTGVLVVAGFVGLLGRWSWAVDCVAFLVAVQAVAVRHGQGASLRAYLEAPGSEEPAWWPGFERGFRRYANSSQREQNPLRGAVSRPSRQPTPLDRGPFAKRSAAVLRGPRS